MNAVQSLPNHLPHDHVYMILQHKTQSQAYDSAKAFGTHSLLLPQARCSMLGKPSGMLKCLQISLGLCCYQTPRLSVQTSLFCCKKWHTSNKSNDAGQDLYMLCRIHAGDADAHSANMPRTSDVAMSLVPEVERLLMVRLLMHPCNIQNYRTSHVQRGRWLAMV